MYPHTEGEPVTKESGSVESQLQSWLWVWLKLSLVEDRLNLKGDIWAAVVLLFSFNAQLCREPGIESATMHIDRQWLIYKDF